MVCLAFRVNCVYICTRDPRLLANTTRDNGACRVRGSMTTTKDFPAFVEQRQLWIECFSGEDPNSVCKQLYQMIWNAAAYRIVNEARRLAPLAKEGGVQLNGMMHRLIDSCFWDSQVLAVRRLMDIYPIEEQESKKRDKSVFSLTGLLEDMEHHVHFLTRGNILAAEGLEYDADAVRRKEDAYCCEQIRPETWHFLYRGRSRLARWRNGIRIWTL